METIFVFSVYLNTKLIKNCCKNDFFLKFLLNLGKKLYNYEFY